MNNEATFFHANSLNSVDRRSSFRLSKSLLNLSKLAGFPPSVCDDQLKNSLLVYILSVWRILADIN